MKTPLRLLLLVCLLGLLTLPTAAVPIPWKNCGKSTDVITISKADASIWPPQRGKTITIVFQGNAKTQIIQVTGTYQVVFNGIPIINQRFQRPLALFGPFGETFTEEIPTLIPAGSTITVYLDLADQNKAHAFCMNLTVPVK